jgi:hypothetical protein
VSLGGIIKDTLIPSREREPIDPRRGGQHPMDRITTEGLRQPRAFATATSGVVGASRSGKRESLPDPIQAGKIEPRAFDSSMAVADAESTDMPFAGPQFLDEGGRPIRRRRSFVRAITNFHRFEKGLEVVPSAHH